MEYQNFKGSNKQIGQSTPSKCRRCSLYSSLRTTLVWYLRTLQAECDQLSMSPMSMWATTSVNMAGSEYRSRVFKVVDMILNELQDLHDEHREDNLRWSENCFMSSNEKSDDCSSCKADDTVTSAYTKCTILDYAIRTHDVDLVNVLLSRAWFTAAVLNPTTDLNGLSLAMILPHIEDINVPCCGTYTPLQLATRRRESFAKMLLRRGADMQHILSPSNQPENRNRLYYHGRSVVKWIVGKGNPTLLRAAIDCASINVNDQCNDKGDRILHLAIRAENIAICRVLLKYEASISQQNADDETPLGLALMSPTGHEIARLFLEEGEGISNTTQSFVPELCMTLPYLHIACYTGKLELVKLLLRAKDCDHLDQMSIYRTRSVTSADQHETPYTPSGQFTHDCINGTNHYIPRDFINHEIINISLLGNINCLSNEGYLPLQIAVIGGQISVVKYLLSVGADPCLSNEKGTLFHSAVRSQSIQIMTYISGLLPKHAMNCKDKTGSTPLHLSAKGGNPAMCAFLLEKGASLNDQDKNCETALSIACFFGREENAQLLIQHGADITIADSEGTVPAYWALMNDKVRIATLLLRAGLKITPASFRRIYPRRMRIMQNEHFLHMLEEHMSGVPPLMDLSRQVIRERLCKNAADVTIKLLINTLDIPVILKDFLLLRQHVNHRRFHHQAFD